MLLVKTSWTDNDREGSHESFQLVELAAGSDQEQMRQKILDRLQTPGRRDCTVEFFDPDNVPPGTIPADARVTPGELPFGA